MCIDIDGEFNTGTMVVLLPKSLMLSIRLTPKPSIHGNLITQKNKTVAPKDRP
jgi:hypothetical protein